MELEKEKIQAQLDKMVKDKAFARSKINVRLLQFLVHATLNNKDVKETTIGVEFFGEKYDPIKLDNKVRVYVYHLRKKLDEYYRERATPDDIIFRIVKGQYKVSFEVYKKPKNKSRGVQRRWTVITIIGLLLMTAMFFFFKKTINPFWKTLMKNEFATTLIFGDYFTMEGPIATRQIGAIRDYEINSKEEFKNYLKKHPEQKSQLKASRHQYFNWTAPYCSKMMTQFWTQNDYDFELNQVSDWNASQLGKENVVYFGQTKSMGLLKNILKENFPQYTYKSQKIIRLDTGTGKKTAYTDVISYDAKMTDYTLVAKITMPTGSEMRFFLSDQDCGTISALEFFTNKESVKAFYKKHQLTKKDDFIALFKVTGWLRKSYEMTFVLLDKK